MATLLKTLNATGGRVRRIFTHPVGSTLTETATNTAAGCHDGSNTTRDEVQDVGDGVSVVASPHYAVTYSFDSMTGTGTPNFIRVRLKHKKFTLVDPPGVLQNPSITPLIGTTSYGIPNTQILSTFTEKQWDFYTDPFDEQPWTNSKINAYGTFGFDISGTASDVDVTVDLAVSEIIVEVWGTALSDVPKVVNKPLIQTFITLKRLDTPKLLTSAELEIFNKNYFSIENVLRQIIAKLPP